jgi:small GTP-binding protein
MGDSGEMIPRIIFIGDSRVGKTSLITRGSTDTFTDITIPTVGAGVTPMRVFSGGREIHFHIWDTAGQEMYRSIVPLYFKMAVCAIVVFALDDLDSFHSLSSWIDMLQRNTDRDVPVVIVGNKTDLEERAVDVSQAKSWASLKNYPIFFTSAATGENVTKLMETVGLSYAGNCVHESTAIPKTDEQAETSCC